MNLQLKEDKFHVRAYFAPCACSCKFCCLGDYPQNKRITFDDYEEVLRKFKDITKSYGMRLRSFIYNCPEHDYVGRQIQLYDSLPMERSEYTQLDLNGTKIKTGKELKDWFDFLQESGMEKAVFSWFGLEKMHDEFIHRKGYFAYLTECAKEAKKRKIPVVSKVFLHRGILEEVEQLISFLGEFSDTIICALMEYSGKAKDMPDDFLDVADYEKLSPFVKQYISTPYINKFKSEKEWIKLIGQGKYKPFNIVDYVLYVDADNVEKVKRLSVDEIIQYFKELNTKFQNSFSSIEDLAISYGNTKCETLYEFRDVVRKWLDSHFEKNNMEKDKLFSFTHDCVEWKVYERL